MTSIDTLSHRINQEEELRVIPAVEALEPKKEYSIDLDTAVSLETQGNFSRVVTFELGSNVDDNGVTVEEIDPNNPYAVVLDVWTDGDKAFVLPRSAETESPQDISDKAWNLADWPTGLPIGRTRNDIWEEKTGQKLPGEVSGKHFGVTLKEGVLHFADVGSTNGTRMEIGILQEEGNELGDVADYTIPHDRTRASLGAAAGKLMQTNDNSIQSRLGVEPTLSEIPVEAVDKQEMDYDQEAIERQLQGMQNTATSWEGTLGSNPTFTRSDELYGVSASLAGDMAAFGDIRENIKPEAHSSLASALGKVESTAQLIQWTASEVASNVDSKAYATGAEAHIARRGVESLLRQYGSDIDELRRILHEQDSH